MTRDPEEPKRLLLAGIELLNPVLVPAGFVFTLNDHGKGSGGWFASGSYKRDERRLELHFRYSLGLVQYHVGTYKLDHESYMRFAGVYGQNKYPDFPERPLESFVHLASDISTYCSDFLSGDGKSYIAWSKRLQKIPICSKVSGRFDRLLLI